MERVLIIGGCGRIGSSIAQDIIKHTDAEVTITGRNSQRGMATLKRLGNKAQFQVLDLSDQQQVKTAISKADVVVHSAGPFHYRDADVLRTCIEEGVNYVDVSDQRSFTLKALGQHSAAKSAGVTAIINTGVFPGISNSMVRQGVEALEKADEIKLSYIVAGSGGAGITVMRTTFIGIQQPFEAWINNRWQTIKPYTGRECLDFGEPYGKAHVYWYDMPETTTLQDSFSVNSVITKFGSVPDFYNYATWMMAHGLPEKVLKSPKTVEFLAQVSHVMTDVSDRFTGTGVAMRCDVKGHQSGNQAHYISTLSHESASVAAGMGTGSIVELLLKGELVQPGVHPVEQGLSTELFQSILKSRQLTIEERLNFLGEREH